jgi:hypothetical protein
MSISPIRIPTFDEIEFEFSNPIGSPLETNREWESVVYEVWHTEKIFRYVLYQLDLLKSDVRFAALTGARMSDEEFAKKRDLALTGIRSITEFLNENKSYLKLINKAVVELSQIAEIYRNLQKK